MKDKIIILVLVTAIAAAVIYFIFAHILSVPPPSTNSAVQKEAAVKTNAPSELPAADTNSAAPILESTLFDQKAHVFHIQGTARILKKGTDTWTLLSAGTVISAGDQVKTEADSLVEIHYDDFLLNVAMITADSLAEFMSIEPTKIFISNGAIYNSLEGLPEGMTYDVITPTAVGGVRSTVFMRSYDSSSQSDQTVVLDGTVYLAAGTRDAAQVPESEVLLVEENQQFSFTGEELSSGKVKDLKPEPVTKEQQEKTNQLFSETKKRVTSFAGGEAAAKQVQAAWNKVKTDPDKKAAMKNQIRQINQERSAAQRTENSPAAVRPQSVLQANQDSAKQAVSEPEKTPAFVTLQKESSNVSSPEEDEEIVDFFADVYDLEGNPIKSS